MMHIRGHPSDYDGWAAGGATGWSYKDCLPYFQKLEDQEDDTSPWAGHGGPLPVTNAGKHDPNPTSRAFIDACLELGYPGTEDFNGPNMEGTGWHHINVVDGKRFAAYRAYLEPALARPNLTFETGALASRLIVEDGRCTGVEYLQHSRHHKAHASAEVIVCAGAIESPKLLLLSGIGDPKELKAVGVEPLVDLPGVGRNFHNHVLTGVIHESPAAGPGRQAEPVGERAVLEVRSGRDRPRPADRVRPRPVQHHHRPGPPELDQHPARAGPTEVPRLGPARRQRPDVPPARQPELSRRGERHGEDGQSGQDLARDLRDEGVRTVGRRRN